MSAPTCPHCNLVCRLTDGREVYPHRPDLSHKKIFVCTGSGCDARVGTHPNGKPLGTPANAELRNARMTLHKERLDPLWETADQCGDYEPESQKARVIIRKAARTRVYAYLAEQLGITRDECHTGMFDIERCRAAWRVLQNIDYRAIRAWHKSKSSQEAA